HIGQGLYFLGKPKEALEQHYLPYASNLLAQPLDKNLDPTNAHMIAVAHALVAEACRKFGRNQEALAHFQKALQFNKIKVERDPNDARWARDWSSCHSDLGQMQIRLGQFDEGMTNLQEGVRLAESLVERDPSNGPFQERLIGALEDEAKGFAKNAAAPGISP